MMEGIMLVLYVVIGITFVSFVTLILFWKIFFKETITGFEDTPDISIIVAARNEEQNIARCLNSLLLIDYPTEKMEILIGNDSSWDDTLKIAQEFEKKFNGLIKVFDIKDSFAGLKGKANILAHLCKKAKGDYLFFTDADIEVPSLWIKTMLSNFDKSTAIITGFTGIKGKNLLAIFQNIDWFFALGIVKILSDMNKPVTSIGNNMAVTSKAYNEVGGYEGIPFSITEDYELYKQILKKGFKGKHLLSKEILCWSQPKNSLKEILQQRKRWMFGAIQTPFFAISILTIQALYFPAIISLFALSPLKAGILFLLKICLQAVFIKFVLIKGKVRIDCKYLFFYEFYSVFLSLILMIYFIIPMKVEWKGRKY